MRIGIKNIGGFDEVVFADTLPEGYSDVTSVRNYIKYGEEYFKDYKWVRTRLQELDWESLSPEEKEILAQRKCTSVANCKAILGDSYEYWLTRFDIESISCRRFRYAFAKTILMKNVSVADQFTILSTMGNLAIMYVEYGVEGIGEGDPVDGLFNYIEATSSYALNGLASMNLTMTNSITKQQMITLIMRCLRDGEY